MVSDAELLDSGAAKGYMDEFSGLTAGSGPDGFGCYNDEKPSIKERLVQSMKDQGFECTDDEAKELADAVMEALTHDKCVTRSNVIMHRFASKEVHKSGKWLTAFVYLGYDMAFDAKMQIVSEIPDLASDGDAVDNITNDNAPLAYSDSDFVPVDIGERNDLPEGIVVGFDWP